MSPDSEQGTTLADTAVAPSSTVLGRPPARHSASRRRGAGDRVASLVPKPSWMTALAFSIVILPFLIILARLLFSSPPRIYLPDDLALIDLHTRRALIWKQQLGVFDRYDWNHPGPSYFYILSVFYRVFGSGAQAMFIGATTINALAAVACVGVVRKRATPARALWAAFWVCVLASIMATESAGSITYSEGALGGLVSPWNPMVVIFPLLLFILLCAAAMDRSALSLGAAVLVGSFIVQANISTLPLLAALFVVAGAVWVVTVVAHWWSARSHPVVATAGNGMAPADTGVVPPDAPRSPSPRWRRWVMAAAGLVIFILMWLPPVIQQVTNNPGNFTLIYRFFTAGHKHWPLPFALRAVASVYGVIGVGPSEIMSSYLGRTPHHAVVAYGVTAVGIAIAIGIAVFGIRQGRRFAAGLGVLTLVGSVAMVFAVTHVVRFIFGYLVIWAIVIPVAAFIGLAMLQFPLRKPSAGHRPLTSAPAARLALCLLGLLSCVVLVVRVLYIPSLTAVSNPEVARMYSLVAPALQPDGTVFVGNNGAGTANTSLVDTEEFIGLVNALDERGFHPKVNHVWKPEFGPGYLSNGHDGRQIQLYTWTPQSSGMPGYVGRVGDVAVFVLTYYGQPVEPVK